jgi:uncharacterized protein (DUF1778 family)
MTEKREERIDVRVTKAGKAKIEEMAEAEQREFSDMVRLLLQRGIAASLKLGRR